MVALLYGISVSANAEEVGGYVGGGVGIPQVAYGSSSLGYKIFGGYKVHDFAIGTAGTLGLSIEGEYIDFGSSSWGGATWTQSGFAVSALGSWTLPRKWAGWADEKLAVLAKAGQARILNKSNSGLNYTYTGVTEGIGAEYRLLPNFSVQAMDEYYPGTYNIIDVAGVFRF